MTYRVNLRLPFALSAAALVSLTGGCDDRQSAADKAITVQAREMHALSADSPSPSLAEVEAANLGKLGTALSPHASSGTAGEKSAASMMLAQSNLTLAEHAMSETAGHVINLGNLIAQVDGSLSMWRKHQAVKEAAASYDPAPQLADIAKGKGEKDTAIAAERQRRSQLESQLNDLLAKAKQKTDAVGEREAQYAQLMGQAAKLSATDGVPLVEQANGIKREADSLRMAGTKLQAQADVIAPQVREADAIIKQLENQKKDMEATEIALAKHLSDSRATAANAGAEAEKAAGTINELMVQVTKAQEEAEAGFSKAEGLYSKAVQGAREAAKESRGAGKALVGDAQLATGFMHWQHAQSLRVYGALLNSLANVKPPLRESASYAEKATQVAAAAATATTSAGDSLKEAKDTYDGVSVQGAAKERLESLTNLLTAAASASQGDTAQLSTLAGVPPTMMSATPSNGAAPGGDAKATAEAFLASLKSGDSSAMFTLIDMPESVRTAMAPMVAAGTKIDNAFKSKFGQTFTEVAAAQPGMGAMMAQMDPTASLASLKTLNATDLKIEASGETAVVKGGSETFNLKKVGDKWLVSIPALEAAGEQMAAMAPMLKPVAKALEDFAGEVESGKFPDANAAFAAFMQKMASMGGGMPPPGGG